MTNIWERSAQNKTTLETAHTISLIPPSKSSCSSSTSTIDPTSSISMSAKIVLRVEWNETVRTRRVPFDTKKFSNLSPEILVEWKAPLVFARMYIQCNVMQFNTLFIIFTLDIKQCPIYVSQKLTCRSIFK